MKINLRAPIEEQSYQRWFAWYPAEVETNNYVWLEYVERKKHYPFEHTKDWFWIYRLPDNTSQESDHG